MHNEFHESEANKHRAWLGRLCSPSK
jgi:hypothetical protein